MTSRPHFMAIYFLLLAVFWGIPGALAQDRQVSIQSGNAGLPNVADVSRSVNWDTIKWVERRYKIEAIRFKARKEAGISWWGSDEVMVETSDAKGWTVTDEIGGIDSGDTHNFDPAKSCIVAVRPGIVVLGKTSVCEEVGESAPLGFKVEFWEQDSIGFPYGFCVGVGNTPEPGRHIGPHTAACPGSDGFNDFIGSAQIDYSSKDLEAALPNVGEELIESITMDPCPGQICSSGWGPWSLPDYTFTWRVTRLPDVQVNLGLMLDEMMQRSGIRSELEAIVVGLRYLRAPNPHEIKPEKAELSPKP